MAALDGHASDYAAERHVLGASPADVYDRVRDASSSAVKDVMDKLEAHIAEDHRVSTDEDRAALRKDSARIRAMLDDVLGFQLSRFEASTRLEALTVPAALAPHLDLPSTGLQAAVAARRAALEKERDIDTALAAAHTRLQALRHTHSALHEERAFYARHTPALREEAAASVRLQTAVAEGGHAATLPGACEEGMRDLRALTARVEAAARGLAPAPLAPGRSEGAEANDARLERAALRGRVAVEGSSAQSTGRTRELKHG